ncbi:MAG TPA: hypothetical protein VES20_15975 [Bryobacteraceae bacterium]|nr:hypothetical protein [Bryobacteraceae bacterium]
MKNSIHLVAVSLMAAMAAYAQPTASAVMNNASYTRAGLPNAGIAQGSMVAIFGTGLASGNMTATSFPLQTNMGGTSVRVTVGGTSVDALMVYTTPNQIGAIIPSNTPVGQASAIITLNGQASRPVNFEVVPSSFGIFTVNQRGSGPGIVQNVISEADRPINALTAPARPGQTMVLWGTGLGPTTQNEAAGAVPGDLPVSLEVWVGGRRATVTYKGRSGCCAGIDQIAFTVPEGVEGCYVPVIVKTGNVVSNFATMSVARSGNACSDPNGYGTAELETAMRNGNARIGSINLSRTTSNLSAGGMSVSSRTDSGFGSFDRFTFQQLTGSQGASAQSFMVSLGACSVMTFEMRDVPGDVNPVVATPLDAGPAISVNGPKGQKQLTKQDDHYYAQLGGGTSIPGMPNIPGMPAAEPDYLDAGNYTISAPGGSGPNSIGNFSVQFTMPQFVTWTNESSISNVNRASDLRITWTGGAPDSFVQMSGMSINRNVAAMFICTERASAQQFTIPSYVLAVLPASSRDMPGNLTVSGTTAPVRFTARDLDAGYVTASSASTKTVTYQ